MKRFGLRLLLIGLPLLALATLAGAQSPPERVPITAENANQIVPLGSYSARIYNWLVWASRDGGSRVLLSRTSGSTALPQTAWMSIDFDEGSGDRLFLHCAGVQPGRDDWPITTQWGIGTHT